jgi:hypothetical protein
LTSPDTGNKRKMVIMPTLLVALREATMHRIAIEIALDAQDAAAIPEPTRLIVERYRTMSHRRIGCVIGWRSSGASKLQLA